MRSRSTERVGFQEPDYLVTIAPDAETCSAVILRIEIPVIGDGLHHNG